MGGKKKIKTDAVGLGLPLVFKHSAKEAGRGIKWAVVRLGPHAGALLWAKAQGNSHDYGSDPHVSCKAVGGVSLAHGPPSSIAREDLPQHLCPSRQ